MEIRVLRYFLAVAREESISKAADSLHLTQPTLSRQLMEMEEQLGTKLFVRGNRKVSLTEEGVFLRQRAQEIIDLVDKTEAEFLVSDDMISGDVYIGGGETDAMRLIAKTIKYLNEHYPYIRYHLYSGNADDVMERLDKGLLDFGILIEPADISKYDYLKLPTTDTWGLLVRRDSVLTACESISPHQLLNLPLICSRQSLVRNEISGWLGYDFERLNIISTYNLIYNAALMVEEGVGYALCLDKLVNTSSLSHLCFKPLEPKLEAHLNLVFKKHQMLSSPAKLFLKELQNQLRQVEELND